MSSHQSEEWSRLVMKKIAVVVMFLMVVGLASSAAAQDNSMTLYKSKCAACHGVDGNAETPMAKKQNIKSFKDPSVQKMSEAELVAMIGEGGSKPLPTHQFSKKGLTPEQVKALAGYVKQLGK
jgi:mono/diheme cytochrome c family protein